MCYRLKTNTCSWPCQSAGCFCAVLLLILVPWYASQWQSMLNIYNKAKLEPEEMKLVELQKSVCEAFRITRSSFAKLLLRESLNIVHQILRTMSHQPSQNSCTDTGYGKPYTSNSQQSKCYTAPLDSLVEVLLYANTCEQALKLICNLRQYYPQLYVRIGVSGRCNLSKSICNISHVQWHFYMNDGAHVWVRLSRQVRTKYVLVGSNLVQLSQHTDLDRLVRFILCPGLADVVGGAVRREPEGIWDLGCYQTSLRNFTLRIRPGYEQSLSSCAYCDYITSPFLLERRLLQRILGRSTLSGLLSVMDLFLQLVHSGLDVVQLPRIVSCVDVIFHVADPTKALGLNGVSAIPESDWLKLARKWLLTDILLPGGVEHRWSCRLIGISCYAFLETGMLIPPCCLREQNHCLLGFLNLAGKERISTRILGNDLVGLMNPYMSKRPWLVEIDLVWNLSNYSVIYKKIQPQLYKNYGCRMFTHCDQSENCSRLIIGSSNWNSTIRGDSVPSGDEPPQNSQSTLINVNGLWTPTYFNPGLVSTLSSSVQFANTSTEIEDYYWSSGMELFPLPYCYGKHGRFNCLSGNYLPLGNIQFHELDT